MAVTDPPEYSVFDTVGRDSQVFAEAELAVVQRAFELGHLRYLSKGKRRNQVDFAKIGMFPTADSLEAGLFEWAITIEAVEQYRSFEFLRTTGRWPTFLAENPLRGGIRSSARRIGLNLGLAVRLWNDLGEEWPDFWDHFSKETSEGRLRRWAGFLAYYRCFQRARRETGDDNSYGEWVEVLVSRMVEASRTRNPSLLNLDSKPVHVARGCGVEPHQMWFTRTQLIWWSYIKDRRTVWFSTTPIPEEQLPERIRAARKKTSETLGGLVRSDRLRKMVGWLTNNGVEFALDPGLPSAGCFDVYYQWEAPSLRMVPRIRVNIGAHQKDVSLNLILAHEIGHFLVNFHWMTELALADFVIAFYSGSGRVADTVEMLNLKQEVQKRIMRFYSAIETAADEITLQILFPEEEIGALYARCLRNNKFQWYEFHSLAQARLGIEPDSNYYSRFESIIRDWAPGEVEPIRGLITGKSIRRARFLTSMRRVEELLQRFWSDLEAVVAAGSGGKELRVLGE